MPSSSFQQASLSSIVVFTWDRNRESICADFGESVQYALEESRLTGEDFITIFERERAAREEIDRMGITEEVLARSQRYSSMRPELFQEDEPCPF